MFDKLKYNNLVISNKVEIQRARVLVVRKIINKIRKLQKSIAMKHSENNSIKLKKCISICEKVKKIKPMKIMKNVLILEKNPTKIMTNANSKPEEVAVAMLASNKIIQKLKTRIFEELNLSTNSIEGWKPALIEMDKSSQKKQSRKARKKLKEMNNGDNDVSQKKARKADKNLLNVEKGEEEIERYKEFSPSNEKNGSHNIKVQKCEIHSNIIKNEDRRSLKNGKEKNDIIINNENINVAKKDLNNKVRKEKDCREVKQTKNISKSKMPTVQDHKPGFKNIESVHTNKDVLVKKSIGIVDPFFKTESGDFYIANFPINSETTNVPKDDKVIKEQNFELKRKDFINENRSSYPKKPKQIENTKQTRLETKPVVLENKSDLHPSWIAKQKQKPSITTFQGKKITFDNHDE